jgi:ABC-2 type transport system ATP-binding protein
MRPLISLKNVTKKYGSLTAVNDLSLDIEKGEIFAFLGPNGSGKTTIFLMLMGLTAPTFGVIEACGRNPVTDPVGVKREISYLPDTPGFYDDMTAAENLLYSGALSGLSVEAAERSKEMLLERVGLYDEKDRNVGQFSRGMKQRLGIADVLMASPKAIILDEPALGLDPTGTRELLSLITELAVEHGITILLSSHQLEHVQMLNGRIGIFKKGVMKASGTTKDMAERTSGGLYEMYSRFFMEEA